MTRRPGRSTLGCLFGLLLVVAVGYFAANVGEVYMRHLAFRDAVRQEVRFARMRTDEAMRLRLAAKADSLGLPPEAARLQVRRGERVVTVDGSYTELVELPLFVREFTFDIHEEGEL